MFWCLLFLRVVSSGCTNGQFPNIGYIAKGYDIVYGNPLSHGPDPGFAFHNSPYDTSNYSNGATTSDLRYCIPNGIEAVVSESCVLDWTYSSTTGVNSYSSQVSQSVSLSFEESALWENVKFSASEQYQYVYKTTSKSNCVITSTNATCTVYSAIINFGNPPLLDQGFINTVKKLPTNYTSKTQSTFMTFITNYGTHTANGIEFGCRYGQQSTLQSTDYSSFTSSNLEISAAASFSAIFASAAVNTMTSTQQQQAKDFQSVSQSQSVYCVGGTCNLPANYDLPTWQQSCEQEPMPVKLNLISIKNLLTVESFPDDRKIEKKQAALQMALNNYCEYLLSNNESAIQTCEGYPPDPPYPDRSIFGGLYTVNDCGADGNRNNPYTNTAACPSYVTGNWIAVQVGRFMGGTIYCGDNLYLCVNQDYHYIDPLQFFGGIYQQNDYGNCQCGSNLNPFTNTYSCSQGFSALLFGRVQTDTGCNHGCNGVGATLYFCYNQTLGLANKIFGGFWQQTAPETSTDFIPNQYTHSASCPINFGGHSIAWLYAPEKGYGANIDICLANVY